MSRPPLALLRAYAEDLCTVSGWRLWLALALTCAVSVTEGIGLLLLVPLLQVVGLNVDQGGTGTIERWVSGAFAELRLEPTIVGVLIVYVATIAVHSALRRWQAVVGSTLDERYLLHMRWRLYRAILNARWLFITRMRRAKFTQALTTELDRVGELSYTLFSLFIQILVGAVYLAFALHLSPPMTALAVLSGGGLVLILRRYTEAARTAGEQLSEATEALFAATTEHLEGLKTAKSYGAEARNFDIFSAAAEWVARVEIEETRSYADAAAWFRVGSVLILSVIVFLAVEVFRLTPAELLILLFLFSRLVPKASGIHQDYQHLVNALPAFANVGELIASCEAAAEPESMGSEPVTFTRAVELERVSFRYRQDDPVEALSDVHFRIPACRTTAVVGPSGGGKTTIADTVMGLIVPERGEVLIDGAPLRPAQMRAWREAIGYVAQDTTLFHDSVRANLLWAEPDATETELWEALRLAAADAFVARLPHGLDTAIGDRGVRLSGGERQRLALARALLRKPSLLILDEATSALDTENERRIRDALAKLHGRLTILVITHRLSAIQDADTIYVLERGRLLECGTWADLMRRPGRLRELHAAQAAEEIEQADPATAALADIAPRIAAAGSG